MLSIFETHIMHELLKLARRINLCIVTEDLFIGVTTLQQTLSACRLIEYTKPSINEVGI